MYNESAHHKLRDKTQHLRTDNKQSRITHNSSEIWIFYAGVPGIQDNRVTTAKFRTVKLQRAIADPRDSPNLQIIRVVNGYLSDAPIKSLRQYIRLQARNTTRIAASISMKSEIWGALLRCAEPSDLSFRSNSIWRTFHIMSYTLSFLTR